MVNILFFFMGAIGYELLEIAWRGYTHPSMAVAGGFCFVIIRLITIHFQEESIIKKSLLSAFAITCIELITGVFVNIKLKLNVWDYSDRFLNISGQICPLYTILWFVLSIILISIIDFIIKKRNKFSNKQKI